MDFFSDIATKISDFFRSGSYISEFFSFMLGLLLQAIVFISAKAWRLRSSGKLLKPYDGEYHCYRWSRGGIVYPSVSISKPFMRRYEFSWKVPEGPISKYKDIYNGDREIYISGHNIETQSRSLFVLYKNEFDNMNYIYGIYTFLSMGHSVISGVFLLSSKKLPPLNESEIKLVLPKEIISVDKGSAQAIYEILEKCPEKTRLGTFLKKEPAAAMRLAKIVKSEFSS